MCPCAYGNAGQGFCSILNVFITIGGYLNSVGDRILEKQEVREEVRPEDVFDYKVC